MLHFSCDRLKFIEYCFIWASSVLLVWCLGRYHVWALVGFWVIFWCDYVLLNARESHRSPQVAREWTGPLGFLKHRWFSTFESSFSSFLFFLVAWLLLCFYFAFLFSFNILHASSLLLISFLLTFFNVCLKMLVTQRKMLIW